MLDPKLIRNQLADVAAQLKRRAFDLDVEQIEQLEEMRGNSEGRFRRGGGRRSGRFRPGCNRAALAVNSIQPQDLQSLPHPVNLTNFRVAN